MGTVIEVTLEHDAPEIIIANVEQKLKMYEHRFSANNPASELGQVNQAAGLHPVKVHPDLFKLAQIGKEHSCASASNLNVAIGPLVQTWRIGFADAKVPSAKEIQELLAITDPENIVLDEEVQTIYLSKPGMKLDLGALAKGYIADRIIEYLKEEGVTSALINLGGNLVVSGNAPHREDGYWRIGIQNPAKTRGDSQVVLKVLNQSVVTSGIYERHLEKDSRSYHHILNPDTGYPLETEIASLTIVSDLSIDGEIWTTRLFGKHVSEIMQQIESLPGIEGLIITQTGQLLPSSGLKEMLA
ncbi:MULTISPECIES: FAD:protein FMN transferase [unclassified Jeotgalibaca]|uniref:FAD:protein FMN transferase n=1 Tax=unclassified Jeotgalibaca TaxID=2621505 RepID=UPI003FD5FCF5